jgi:HK97 gp10 family phage protein
MIENNLNSFKQQFRKNKKDFLEASGKFGKSKMDHHVAVDTGYLKSKNEFKVSGENEVHFINNGEYAGFQEYGTYKMPAHPFVRPSVYNYIPRYMQIAKKQLGKNL